MGQAGRACLRIRTAIVDHVGAIESALIARQVQSTSRGIIGRLLRLTFLAMTGMESRQASESLPHNNYYLPLVFNLGFPEPEHYPPVL